MTERWFLLRVPETHTKEELDNQNGCWEEGPVFLSSLSSLRVGMALGDCLAPAKQSVHNHLLEATKGHSLFPHSACLERAHETCVFVTGTLPGHSVLCILSFWFMGSRNSVLMLEEYSVCINSLRNKHREGCQHDSLPPETIADRV